MRRENSSGDWLWPSAFCAYFLLQAVLRLTVHGPALELDEAEAFWFARDLAPGYGAQPPLYFWLQWASFQLLGQGVLALAVLKNLLLAATAVTVFTLFRAFAPAALAGAASLSLVLLPEISWEGQRALTHSALILLFSALVLLAVWHVLRRGNWANYLVLGLVLGLGVLSKHNFHLLWVAVLLAVVTDGTLRAALNRRRLAVAIAVAAILVLPYLVWAIAHPELATGSAQKLGVSGQDALAARLQGLVDMAGMLVGFFALSFVWLGPVLVVKRRSLASETSELGRFLWRVSVASFVVVLLLVVLAGVTNIRGRWIMPLVWPVVPLVVVALWPALTARGRTILSASFAALWVAVMAVLPMVQSYRDADFGRAYAELPDEVPIAVAQTWILGNLALVAPDRPIHMISDDRPLPETVLLIAPKGGLAALAGRLGYPPPVAARPLDLGPVTYRREFEFAVVLSVPSG